MESRKSEIYNDLKRRIIEFQYKPGAILNELDLSEEFGVSRSPIRTVLQELERDKLIAIVPRYGAQVAPIDFRNVKDLFEVTKQLDTFATKLAVKNISPGQLKELKEIIATLDGFKTIEDYQEAIILDERFHQIIFQAADNKWLVDTVKDLHIHTERLWHYCKDYFRDMSIFTRTFKKIVEAMEAQDEAAAYGHASDHIDDFLTQIKHSLF